MDATGQQRRDEPTTRPGLREAAGPPGDTPHDGHTASVLVVAARTVTRLGVMVMALTATSGVWCSQRSCSRVSVSRVSGFMIAEGVTVRCPGTESDPEPRFARIRPPPPRSPSPRTGNLGSSDSTLTTPPPDGGHGTRCRDRRLTLEEGLDRTGRAACVPGRCFLRTKTGVLIFVCG